MLQTRQTLADSLLPAPGAAPVEWTIAEGLVPYEEAVSAMEARVAAINASYWNHARQNWDASPITAPRFSEK